ncbi:MAG: 1-deoxy-D-xylulose-5-phosphate reductoisomerase [Lachnospiraceae bacterium]|nr:1-deoxy-D-xylulose-5-phosphate reductoisomerase [Lachnospiraceae bacterium]
MKHISLIGSTGSIGTQTLDVIRRLGTCRVSALAAFSNVNKIEAQAREFKPLLVCVYDEAAAADLKTRLADTDIRVVSGEAGLEEAAACVPADIVSLSLLGMIGIRPTLAAIRAGRDCAFANKETLVCAGHLIMPAVKEYGTRFLPVDSEHGAVFQCLQGEDPARISRLLITASGGPFRGRKKEELARVTPADALKHPNWTMGAKITIDSSTLVNKGLEVMEAHHLFGMPYDKIEAVIHPQSVIHSMVEYTDGSVKAQLAVPDMRLPIEYALTYPDRGPAVAAPLDFMHLPPLTFEAPDTENFPGLALAYEAGKTAGTMPTVYNAANEWAVAQFLAGKIGYLDIAGSIEKAMKAHSVTPDPDLEAILAAEKWTRDFLQKG